MKQGEMRTDIRAKRVLEVDYRHDARWAEFVCKHPHALIYHHPTWLEVVVRAYGHEPIGLMCEGAGGQVEGVLPLVHMKGWITGRRVISLPHTPAAGPLATNREAHVALIESAIEQTERRSGSRLQLKMSSVGLIEGLSEDLVGTPQEPTYAMRLPERLEDLRFGNSRNHARIKWAVNKAARSGVSVREATSERELRAWYKLYLETMRWHAALPHPYRFFRLLWDVQRPQGMMRLLVAERRDARQTGLLAGSILLTCSQTVSYAYNGRRGDSLSLRTNDILQWHAIRDSCQAGYRRYDFGDVPAGNTGLSEFKLKWGAAPGRLHRFQYPATGELDRVIPSPRSYSCDRLSIAWRRVPLSTMSALGNLLYGRL